MPLQVVFAGNLAVAARVRALDNVDQVDRVVMTPGVSLKSKGHHAGRACVLLRVREEMAPGFVSDEPMEDAMMRT
jgi:hypothetical protein